MTNEPYDAFASLEPMKPLPSSVKRKQLAFRSRYRGIKEMDIIMAQFADVVLPDLPKEELASFEALLRESDHDLYDWICGRSKPPSSSLANPLLNRLLDFEFTPSDR